MSTRSQLRFVQRVEQTDETDGSADRVAQVYRHSDGYPGSVLQDLAQLKELLDATRAERGPGYTAATFVFLDKLSTVSLYLDGDPERTIDAAQPADLLEPSNMEHLDQPLFLLGHGVEDPADGIHGDEEYLYVVEFPTENPFDEPAEWTVKVSGHSAFPRWDGPTDEAFERANWQFRGPLEDALRDVVTESEIRQPKSKNVFIRVSVKVYTDDFKGRTRRD
jgi:hypothetical protein